MNPAWLTDAALIRELGSAQVDCGDHAADVVVAVVAGLAFGGWLLAWAMGWLA